MVTEAILGFFGTLMVWFLDLWPDWNPPTWLTALLQWLEGISYIHHFGAFIPLDAIVNSAVFLLAATTIATAIQGGRLAYSMFSGGGGAT